MNKTIVITGASSGIGAALAGLVGAQGARVVLVARRENELQSVAEAVGERALVVRADVTLRADHERVLAQSVARFGHVDVWVNNAGRGISKPLLAITDTDFDEMMQVNVKSALYGMQTAIPHFQSRGQGHLINVSSMLGRVPYATIRSAYCAAKHALNALTACARMDLRESHPGIHISTVSPGVVATEFGNNALGGGPDSRTLPGAQSVEAVAEVIASLILHPQADVYTRLGMRERVASYFAAEDMAAAESQLAMPAPPAR